jgi:hypothetical protein
MIEMKRSARRGEPRREMDLWLERLTEADHKRSKFQHAYAEDAITLEDLGRRGPGQSDFSYARWRTSSSYWLAKKYAIWGMRPPYQGQYATPVTLHRGGVLPVPRPSTERGEKQTIWVKKITG